MVAPLPPATCAAPMVSITGWAGMSKPKQPVECAVGQCAQASSPHLRPANKPSASQPVCFVLSCILQLHQKACCQVMISSSALAGQVLLAVLLGLAAMLLKPCITTLFFLPLFPYSPLPATLRMPTSSCTNLSAVKLCGPHLAF